LNVTNFIVIVSWKILDQALPLFGEASDGADAVVTSAYGDRSAWLGTVAGEGMSKVVHRRFVGLDTRFARSARSNIHF
jgi:hypothetical protein